MQPDLESIPVADRLGEGIRWHPGEQRLYWVDIERGLIHRAAPPFAEVETHALGFPVACLGFRSRGGLVLGTRHGFARWDAATHRLEPIVDPEPDRANARFNDGAVDRAGRFWAGTMTETGFGNSLYRLDPDGRVERKLLGLGISNGLGWSPDNRTMYLTDSARATIFAFDFDLASGDIERPRALVVATGGLGTPDGLAVDSEGCLWSAHWDGWAINRYDPQGKLTFQIRLPVQRPTSCAFGGADLGELYVTSAWTGLAAGARARQPLAGAVIILHPGVRGTPEPLFTG